MFRSKAAKDDSAAADIVGAPECPHTALTPRWDSLADMGHSEKVSSYHCQSCEESFSREEGEALMSTPPAVLKNPPT